MPVLVVHNYTMITGPLWEDLGDQTILMTNPPPPLKSQGYSSWSAASSLLDCHSNLQASEYTRVSAYCYAATPTTGKGKKKAPQNQEVKPLPLFYCGLALLHPLLLKPNIAPDGKGEMVTQSSSKITRQKERKKK